MKEKIYHLIIYKPSGVNTFAQPLEMRYLGDYAEYKKFLKVYRPEIPGVCVAMKTKFEVVVYDDSENPRQVVHTDDLDEFDQYPNLRTYEEA